MRVLVWPAMIVWLSGIIYLGVVLGNALSGYGNSILAIIYVLAWIILGRVALGRYLPASWTKPLIRRDAPPPR